MFHSSTYSVSVKNQKQFLQFKYITRQPEAKP